MTVTGNGGPGSPYTISVTEGALECSDVMACVCEAAEAGNGIDCAAEPASLSVNPSTDAGNSLTTGSDGRLYVQTEAPAIRPSARVTRNTAIPNITSQVVPFEVERWDIEGMWAIGAPTLLTVPVGGSGEYEIGANMQFSTATAPNGTRTVAIRVNGVVIAQSTADATEELPSTVLNVSTIWRAAEGDDFDVLVATGAETDATTLAKTEALSPEFWASWRAP